MLGSTLGKLSRLQRLTLSMVLLNAFSTPLMLSSVNVALPMIANHLAMDVVLLSWIPMAYLMASAMFVLIFGRIADMFGRKRIFLIGTSGVIITSLLAAVSVNSTMIIVARFLQGVCAAMLYTTQLAIISSVFPPAKRGQLIGITISVIYSGLTVGPLLGGYVIDQFSWRASFLVHIPLAIIVLLLSAFVNKEWRAERPGRFDKLGAFLYISAIFVLCLSVSYLPSDYSFVLLLIAIAGFVSFFLFERRQQHPLFDVHLFFTNRVVLFSCLAALIIYTATFANVVQISLYLQTLKNLSASQAGLIMMCQPLTMALFSPLAGRLLQHFQAHYLASMGMALSGLGLWLLAYLDTETTLSYVISALVLTGFGFSLFSSPNVNTIMSAITPQAYASANSVIATMRIIGQLGSMVLVTLIFALMVGTVELSAENYFALEAAIQMIFTTAALLCLPGFYFSITRGKAATNPA